MNINEYQWYQWEILRILKLRFCTICLAIFCGDIPWAIGLTWALYMVSTSNLDSRHCHWKDADFQKFELGFVFFWCRLSIEYFNLKILAFLKMQQILYRESLSRFSSYNLCCLSITLPSWCSWHWAKTKAPARLVMYHIHSGNQTWHWKMDHLYRWFSKKTPPFRSGIFQPCLMKPEGINHRIEQLDPKLDFKTRDYQGDPEVWCQ